MLDQTIVIYCICDEVSKAFEILDDPQCKMSSAEIMTFAILSATLFGCDYKRTRLISMHHRYFSKILSHSQLVRRIHNIPCHAWTMIFSALQLFLRDKEKKLFIVDSFPIKAYENHKSFRARIFSDKEFHGYTATKKQFFFGIKVHMVVDINGVPIEFSFSPGSIADITVLKNLRLELPKGSILCADKAYSNYLLEEYLQEHEWIKLLAKRRKNHKRKHSFAESVMLARHRNRIETVFSSITSRMPRHIKVRTEKGLYLKLYFFILAYMVNLYFPLT